MGMNETPSADRVHIGFCVFTKMIFFMAEEMQENPVS